MDAPRRWQVASLATAVTGLGIGGMLVDRSTSAPVAPIVLEVAFESPDPGERFRLLQEPVPIPIPGPEIVTADVITGTTPISGGSTASPDDEPEATTAGTTAPAPTRAPAPVPAPSPAPSPADPSAPTSTDSPDSVDSVDRDESVDSD